MLALGAEFDLRAFPSSPITIRISTQRIENLVSALTGVLEVKRLNSGLAGQLWGKLQHACCMLWGRYGACKLRALTRRQHEQRTNLNPQLRACLQWWVSTLQSHAYPREIPISVGCMPVLVSYSDGEGSNAGVGVAVWGSILPRPLAAYCRVPREVRMYWSACGSLAPSNDIYEIEAIGPLVVLATWPRLLQGCLWIHFLDNAAAQAAYVKGSSSVHSGDVIVGKAWETVARWRLFPWFDRVGSKSNPVDGLSRGRRDGPWDDVETGRFPQDLLRQLRQSHFTR